MIPAVFVRLLLLFALMTGQVTQRTPASVVSPDAVDWLERSTREEEERPEIVVEAMNLRNGSMVADVGAGSGFYSRRVARAVAPKGVVYATDIQPEMLEALRASAAREKLTNIVPILGTETDPKLPKSTFDWVLLVDVYHEFQEPKPMLAS